MDYNKSMFFGFFAFVLLSGSLFAISGASTSLVTTLRWNGAVTATAINTQGGNITRVSVSTTQLTTKWASYHGNVSGAIRLADTQSGNYVYQWSYAPTNGGEVCVSTDSAQTFSSPVNATTAQIDSVFSTSSPDNASTTFASICPTLTLSTGAMTSFIASDLQSSSSFWTCAGTFGGGTAATNHAFCTNINASGTNYDGTMVHYELIVPTGGSNRAYYFYLELN